MNIMTFLRLRKLAKYQSPAGIRLIIEYDPRDRVIAVKLVSRAGHRERLVVVGAVNRHAIAALNRKADLLRGMDGEDERARAREARAREDERARADRSARREEERKMKGEVDRQMREKYACLRRINRSGQ